jgi:hypothetical protein
MTQAFFLAILLAFMALALMRLLGLHIKYERIFKALATVLVMLPLLVIPVLLVFVIGFGLYMLLHATGLVPSIPDQYVLWALIAIAVAIPGVIWIGYIVLVVREQGRPMHHRKRRPIKRTARRPNKHSPHNT